MKSEKTLTSHDYKATFENSPAAKLLIDTDAPLYTILDVNSAYLSATNSQRDLLVGKSVFSVFPANPDDVVSKNIERTIESFEETIRSKKPHTMSYYRYDIPIQGTDNFEEHYWTTTNNPVLDEYGNVKFFIHSPLNITDAYNLAEREKHGLEALKRQREQLYSIFMQAPVGIGIFKGPDFIVELINPPLCELYGKTTEELMNKPIFETLLYAKGQGFESLLDNVRLTGVPFVGDSIGVPLIKDGTLETVYTNFVYEPFREDDNTISGVIAIAIDVTTQVVIKQQLELSQQRLSLAVSSLNLGVWEMDLVTGELDRSLKYAQIFGEENNQETWQIEDFWNRIYPEDLEALKDAFHKSINLGKLDFESRIIKFSGETCWVHIVGEVIYKNAVPHRMIGTIQDITERKHLERQKDEFISIISHELKTPITSLKAYSQIVEKRLTNYADSTSIGMIHKMGDHVNKLTVLIQDLLDVTRIENNKLTLRITRFTFNELANDIIDELNRIYPKHTIEIIESGTVILQQDREKTEQVLRNLLTNALKYSPDTEKVIISISENEEILICSVQDFGIGISPEHQQHVFERFYQAREKNANLFPGLGLGLYICQQIIEQQGGHIKVESEPEKGSVFTFSLPKIGKQK